MTRLVEVDESAWPIILVRIPSVLDLPAIQSMFDGLDRVVARESKFATVVDTRALTQFPNAIERKIIAKFMIERTTAEALYNLGNAVVMSSPAARAVFTAIQWLRRPVTAHYMAATTVAGIDWCCMRLKQAGIARPATIDALRESELQRGSVGTPQSTG
jgi:hypothetical protein